MKKEIAVILTLIMATGSMSACTQAEQVNTDIKTSVVSKAADVAVSETTSEINETSQAETTTTAETKTTEKATVSQETNPAKRYTKSKEKYDTVHPVKESYR